MSNNALKLEPSNNHLHFIYSNWIETEVAVYYENKFQWKYFTSFDQYYVLFQVIIIEHLFALQASRIYISSSQSFFSLHFASFGTVRTLRSFFVQTFESCMCTLANHCWKQKHFCATVYFLNRFSKVKMSQNFNKNKIHFLIRNFWINSIPMPAIRNGSSFNCSPNLFWYVL